MSAGVAGRGAGATRAQALHYKKIAFLAPRPDLSPEAFRHYWREVHGPVVARAPGYGNWRWRYVQNHIVAPGPFGRPLGYGGMAEFWLPGPNEEGFAESSAYRDHIQPDERNFIDMDRTISMTAVEHVIVAGRGPAKLVVLSRGGLARRDEGQMQATLRGARRAVGGLSTRVTGYALNLVLENSYRLPGARPVLGPSIDAVHEIWFETREDLDAATRDPANVQALWGTAPEGEGCSSFVAEEIVFFDSTEEKHVR